MAAALAAGLLLPAAIPSAAAAKPRMKAAYAVDRDRDGRVDGVVVTWSKKRRGGADRRPPFAYRVRGYRVTRVHRARKRKQRIAVAERRRCDVGAAVTVRHRRQRLDMRRTDPRVPRITCAETRDRDGDGRVDGLRLSYSRKVRSRSQRRGPFLFSVTGYRVRSVGRARGRYLDIALREGRRPDSGARPVVGYSRPSSRRARRYAVRAGRRADAYTGTFQGTRDGAPPKLLAAATGDADRDGLLDAMNVVFSEPVTAQPASALRVLGMRVRAAAPAGGAVLALSLAESGVRGDARPGVWVAAPGVRDGAGNDALPGAASPLDAAPPVLLGAVTGDARGAPGRIDSLRAIFSEPVARSRGGGDDHPFVVDGRTVSSVEDASGTDVEVRIEEGGAADSGERPGIAYVAGSGPPVTDPAGNQAVDGSPVTFDGAPPALLEATTGDADSDGRLDRVALRFSEALAPGGEGGPAAFAVSGFGVSSVQAGGGPGLTLLLDRPAAPDTGARPSVSYRGGALRDAAGNPVADLTRQAADGAAPVLLDAATGDADDDGRIDRLDTTWSEPLAHPGAGSGPFPLAAAGFSVTGVGPASGSSLPVHLAEPAAHDTGSVPSLSYGGGGDPIRDSAGHEPARRSWPGLTRDALPPRLVSAETGDGDGDGVLDSVGLRFSEPVIHARETAPASFSVAGQTVASAEAAAGDSIRLELAEAGGGNSGARPAVGYAPDGQEDVRDPAGNLAPGATLAQAADGARPVLLEAWTLDEDADGRLDGIATGWSEPLDHPDDATGPFPLSAAGFAVQRVRAAGGQSLTVELAEPAAMDTGSAPTLTYSGGGDPVRDLGGLEPQQRSHAGLTRDALPPRLESASTADADSDGRLDAVDLNWSEDVTGSPGSGPFAVSGRTLGGAVTQTGARTRVPFTEAGFDTDERPAVSYDDVAGDLRDVPEGVGDTSADAPAVTALAPADRAAPVIVAAKTADLTTPGGGGTPNGTIDNLLVTFSEPISHAVDGMSPFSLNVASRTETQVEGDDGGGSDRSLYVTVAEHGAPDGGFTPSVSVTGSGPEADRVKDRAARPNEATPMTFTATADEVRPVLLSAQLGERGSAGGCTKDAVAGIDGRVDCVLGTWSEPVQHAADSDGSYSVLSSGWAVGAGGIPALGPATTLEIPLAAGAGADRDRQGTTLAYDGSIETPVVDAAAVPNESLDGTRTADPPCRDTGLEGNDVQDTVTADFDLQTTSPAFQRKCAFDDDWYRVRTAAAGYLELVTRPAAGVDVSVRLVTSGGTTVAPAEVVATGGAGEVDRLRYTGLGATTHYWVHVSATDTPTPQEGPYCVVFSSDSASEAGCGPLVGQVVFTEVGLGADKFVEIKNDFEVPVDMEGAGAKLVIGTAAAGTRRECTLVLPTTAANSVIDPGEHVIVQPTASADAFGCSEVSSLAASGERLELSANGAIDIVDLTGVITSPVAAEHSLQFVEDPLVEDHTSNDQVAAKWCRTFAAHTKGAAGDGCDEYRINEVLWKPAADAAGSDGRAFVELAGNIPALAGSGLLGGWIVRGVDGLTGDGTADRVLPAGASPRSNGTFVLADGVAGATQVAESDHIWDALDLNSPAWPDGQGSYGPRGVQLLRPGAAGTPPCTLGADAFGWTSTAQPFSQPLDSMRSCPAIEGQEYTHGTVGHSAARDNLSSAGDTSYATANDSGQNRGDFCPQAVPNPGQLNIRPSC